MRKNMYLMSSLTLNKSSVDLAITLKSKGILEVKGCKKYQYLQIQ